MEAWTHLKGFLARRPVHLGFIALILIFLSMLGMQLWFLLKLRQSSSATSRLTMRDFLIAVVADVDEFYRTMAERVLSVPPAMMASDDPAALKASVQNGPVEGVQAIFILFLDARKTPALRVYTPSFDRLELPLDSPEMRAVYLAAAPWSVFPGQPLNRNISDLTVDARDRNSPIVLKPIMDQSRHIEGVVGMLVDPVYFREQYLPAAIARHREQFFPGSSAANVIVSVRDGNGRPAFESQSAAGKGDDVTRRSSFAFTDWRFTIQSRDFTPEQWAQRSFLVNVSLTLLMTVVVMVAIVFAMQGALRAVTLSQMKTDFVSNVSHELRTPLSAIRVLGEFLSGGKVKDPERVRRYGQYIVAETHRLTHLVDSVLDLAKIESGRKTYALEERDVGEVIDAALRSVELGFRQSGFTIHYDAATGPFRRALIDTEALTEAFQNLMENALKYSGSSRDIFVRLEPVNGFVKISVKDLGIGLKPEDKQRIFEKFYRVSNGLVHNVKGTGLGLSIAKHIVDAHRGAITVESEPGRGSTFSIYLASVTGGHDAASIDR